jgi:hypothetical protein
LSQSTEAVKRRPRALAKMLAIVTVDGLRSDVAETVARLTGAENLSPTRGAPEHLSQKRISMFKGKSVGIDYFDTH